LSTLFSDLEQVLTTAEPCEIVSPVRKLGIFDILRKGAYHDKYEKYGIEYDDKMPK
jgi:hypothetical protein